MTKKLHIMLVLFFLVLTFTSAYHDTIAQPVQTTQHPGNTPTYIVIGIIIVIVGAIYWKVKYAPNK